MPPRSSSAGGRPAGLLLGVVILLLLGCHSAVPVSVPSGDLEEGVEHLGRPLPGDLAALYRLRVPSTGGLRVAVLTARDAGRMTISEPFGGAVSVSSWSADGHAEIFDLEQGCRRDADTVSSVFGVGLLPFERAARMLGGRLPSAPGDRVRVADDQVRIDGPGFSCVATVRPGPWRVTAVRSLDDGAGGGWQAALDEHTSSVPGMVRVDSGDGRWAELRLVKLEWDTGSELPGLPDLPPCSDWESGR
jgi:hypothetical protein